MDDDALRRAMLLLFASAKLAVEPAGAAATAALCGPLRERLDGRRVGLIVCGANIDRRPFHPIFRKPSRVATGRLPEGIRFKPVHFSAVPSS